MGLFDSLYFNCPKCGQRLEEQTKNGPCVLDSFDIEQDILPDWLMLDLDKTIGTCYTCNSPYMIDFGVQLLSLKKEVRPLSTLEEFEWHKKEKNKKG